MTPFVFDVTRSMGAIDPSDAALLFQYMCQIENLPESKAKELYEEYLWSNRRPAGPVRIVGREYVKGVTPQFRKISRDDRPEAKLFILMLELVRGFTYSQFLTIMKHLNTTNLDFNKLYNYAHFAKLS